MKKDSASVYLELGLQKENEGKLTLSEQYYKRALMFQSDSTYKAYLYNRIGIICKKQAEYKNALTFYEKAEQFTSDSLFLSTIYGNIGTIYQMKGDFKKALLYNNKALYLAKNKTIRASILNNIANELFLMNDFEKALNYYKESIELKEGDPVTTSYTHSNIALCFGKLNKPDSAEFYFKKTIEQRTKLYGNNHFSLINGYINYGDFLKERKPDKALKFLLHAKKLALLNYGNKHPGTAEAFTCLGNYYRGSKEYGKALLYYQEALISNSRQFNDTTYIQNPNIKDAISELQQLDILHNKAAALQQYGNIKKNRKILNTSLITYELAIQALFRLQNSFMDESKRTLIAGKKDMFAEAAYIAIQLGNYPKAFHLIEKGKASTLLAAVNNNEAIKFSNIPDSLVKLENEYKRLQFVYAANDVTDSVLYYQGKYDSLVNYFEKNYNKYFNLKYGSNFTNPLNYLDTNQVLLEYALTDTLCLTLMVTKEGYSKYIFTIGNEFREHLNTFIRVLKNYDEAKNYVKQYDEYVQSAFYLWNKLIKPLKIPKDKSLIIVPDEKLSYAAFEAFITELPNTNKPLYYPLKYMLYEYPVSYSYSASWLFEPYLGKPVKNIGAFAIEYMGSDEYMALLSSVPVAKKLTSFFKGKRYINEKCTKQAFLENAGLFKILYLSMHGEVDMQNSMNSRLMFYDEDLKPNEIYGMQLNSRLVYLRSCNTGDGKLDKGEGIFSIGRAFAYAGCPTLVTSLWTERDNTSGITLDFYEYMKKGFSLDIAMQKAKMNYLQNESYANPYYWGNKIVMGKANPIKPQSNRFVVILGIIVFLVLFLVSYKKLFRKVFQST